MWQILRELRVTRSSWVENKEFRPLTKLSVLACLAYLRFDPASTEVGRKLLIDLYEQYIKATKDKSHVLPGASDFSSFPNVKI